MPAIGVYLEHNTGRSNAQRRSKMMTTLNKKQMSDLYNAGKKMTKALTLLCAAQEDINSAMYTHAGWSNYDATIDQSAIDAMQDIFLKFRDITAGIEALRSDLGDVGRPKGSETGLW